MTQPHPIGELMPDKTFRRIQTCESLLVAFFLSIDSDKDPRRFAAGSEHDFANGNQTDSRIRQLAFQDDIDLFPQRFHSPQPLIFRGAWLHHEKLPG